MPKHSPERPKAPVQPKAVEAAQEEALLTITQEMKEQIQKITAEEGLEDADHILVAIERLLQYGRVIGGPIINYLEDKEKEAFLNVVDRVAKEVLELPDWHLQDLEETNLSDVQKAEVIVHPLYALFRGESWDPNLWKSVDGDVDKYISVQMSTAASTTLKALEQNPNAVPESYLYLMDIVQELEAMDSPPEKGAVRIFVMPRLSTMPPEMQKAMRAFLEKYAHGSKMYVVDSLDSGTGELKQSTISYLKDQLPNGATLELQGGYLGGCIDGCLGTLKETGRDDVALSVDFDPATAMHANRPDDLRSRYNLPEVTIPQGPVRDAASIRKWIGDNKNTNNTYRSNLIEQYRTIVPEGVKVSLMEPINSASDFPREEIV